MSAMWSSIWQPSRCLRARWQRRGSSTRRAQNSEADQGVVAQPQTASVAGGGAAAASSRAQSGVVA
eukprot:13016200-Alexandrium_andersonii.AAC.1